MFESSRSNERSEKQFQYSLSSIATLLHFLGNTLPEQRTSSSRVVSPAVAVWHREQSIHHEQPAKATRLWIAPGASKPAELIHGYVSVPLTFAPVANDATEKKFSEVILHTTATTASQGFSTDVSSGIRFVENRFENLLPRVVGS